MKKEIAQKFEGMDTKFEGMSTEMKGMDAKMTQMTQMMSLLLKKDDKSGNSKDAPEEQ